MRYNSPRFEALFLALKKVNSRHRKVINPTSEAWENFSRYCKKRGLKKQQGIDLALSLLDPDQIPNKTIMLKKPTFAQPRIIPDSAVLAARELYKSGFTISEIELWMLERSANNRGFGRRTIHRAIRGEGSYGSVKPPPRQPLPIKECKRIRSMSGQGLSYRQLSERTGLSKSTIESVIRFEGCYRWR